MIATASQLLRLFGARRARWVVLLVLGSLVTVTEAVSAAMVYALIDVLSSGSASVVGLGTIAADDGSLGRFALACGLFFVIRGLLVLGTDVQVHRLCYREGAALEERLLRRYLQLPLAEQRRRGQGELVRNVHDSVITVVEGALIPLLAAVALGLKIVAIVAVMLVASPIPTLVGAAVIGPALYLVARAMRPHTQRLGAEVEASLARSLAVATETLRLAPELRLAGRADAFSRRFGAVRRGLADTVARQETLSSVPMVAGETILVLFVVGYLAMGSGNGASETLPTVGLFAYAALRVLPSLLAVLDLLHSVHFTRAALDTVAADAAALGPESAEPAPWPAAVRLRGVTVVHPGADRPALDAVDLDLELGEVVALIGPNGAGKSTLAGLLSGTVLPTSGSISLAGEWAGDGASGIALVAQQVHLLDADVVTNVSLHTDAAERDGDRLTSAVERAGLAEVVDALPDGLATVIGDDGCRLSGGQRQRLAVARALYRDVTLLVIDEGTAALDAESRAALGDVLAARDPQRITVLVTHDRDLAARCSRVVVLDGGAVVADGPPAEVLPGAAVR